MKNKKSMAVVVMILALVFSFSSMTAYAKSDVDFTLNVADDLQYSSGATVEVPIIIKTQTDNGFVDLEMFLIFDRDYLNCSTILDNEVEGFTTNLYERESDGQYGLRIFYSSPTGKKTAIDTQIVFTVTFAVKTGVASNENCMLSLEVKKENVYGLNSLGEKNPNLLTISDAKDKALIIVETNDDAVTTAPEAGDDPNFYISTTQVNPQDPAASTGGGCSAGGVIGIIFGALVVFAAGVVVGFIWCQKRLNEDGYDVPAFSIGSLRRGQDTGTANRRTYSDVENEYERTTGRSGGSGGSIYDDESYAPRPQPRATTRRPSVLDEDDLVDTSYFGRAADTRIGNDRAAEHGAFEDDDDDDEFPAELAPRSGAAAGDRFGGLGGFIGSKRERNDDGYGAFEREDSGDEPDDDKNPPPQPDYRSDRRRYR